MQRVLPFLEAVSAPSCREDGTEGTGTPSKTCTTETKLRAMVGNALLNYRSGLCPVLYPGDQFEKLTIDKNSSGRWSGVLHEQHKYRCKLYYSSVVVREHLKIRVEARVFTWGRTAGREDSSTSALRHCAEGRR